MASRAFGIHRSVPMTKPPASPSGNPPGGAKKPSSGQHGSPGNQVGTSKGGKK